MALLNTTSLQRPNYLDTCEMAASRSGYSSHCPYARLTNRRNRCEVCVSLSISAENLYGDI